MPHEMTHRSLAVAAFNETWALLERTRSAAEDLTMLEVAFTSRHHWHAEGGAQQAVIADWLVSRCFAELGEGRLAVRFANTALDEEPSDAPAWLRASLLEGLARAHASNGDADGRDLALRQATAALEAEQDPEDRAVIEGQLATVPLAR